MRPVRVGSALYAVGPLACPRCNRPAYESAIGILRLTCEGSKCHQSWTAIRLPPGVTGAVLVSLYGSDVSVAVLETAPRALEAEGPLYAQRAPDRPEPLMGWREAREVLDTLMPPQSGEAA